MSLGTLGRVRVFLVNEPELVGQVLQLRWRNFIRDERLNGSAGPVFGHGLLFVEGETWLFLRRTMQPAFSRERLAALVPSILRDVHRVRSRWERDAGTGTPILMAEEMARLTQEVFVRAMFSTGVESSIDGLLAAWNVINEYVTRRLMSPVQLSARWPTPANVRMRRATRVLDSIIGPIIEQRRRELAEGVEREDLLGLLLAARDPETGEGLSDELLRDQILITFFAGFETTSTALTWVWVLLARHPEVERRLHAELDEVLGDRVPTIEDVSRLRYMQQVLDETLRLHPSAFMLARQPVGDQELGGYTIPANSLVFVSPYVLHHDPVHWPDPERFDPERFDPEHGQRPPRFAYMPFGAGPRLCIGKQLAFIEAKLIIATMARRFAPRVVPGVEYRSRPMFTLHHDGGAPMLLERR